MQLSKQRQELINTNSLGVLLLLLSSVSSQIVSLFSISINSQLSLSTIFTKISE
jgi:hypothetical protein